MNFAIVGGVCTLVFALLYAAGRTQTGPLTANAFAVSLTLVLNFTANRWFTFRAQRGSLRLQLVQYATVYAAGLVVSSLVLRAALTVVPHPGSALETFMAVGAGLAATVLRYLLLSAWVFRVERVHREEMGHAA